MDYKVTDSELTSIANAIRTKGGTSAQLEFPTDFVSAIGAISGGGSSNILSGSGAPTGSIGNNGDIYLSHGGVSLPSGYTNLQSIIFNQAYMDTGILTDVTDLHVVADLKLTTLGAQAIWGGAWDANGYFLMNIYDNGNKFRWHSGGKTVNVTADTDRHIIETTPSSLLIDGIIYALSNPGSNSSHNLMLGSVSTGSQGVAGSFVLYDCKIYSGTTLLKHLVPCLDNNNTPCLYDAIQETTLYKSGGTISAGRQISPDEITRAYYKVNGVWQDLIGTDIDDVNTGT